MIHLLFLISFYEQQIEVASLSYLTKFAFLEFGFKKNAEFFVNFSKTAPEMVFGYATKEELEEMEYLKNNQLFCKGGNTLSNVQIHINGGPTNITGIIPSKGKFTPYIFSCNKSYVFKISFNYKNCKRHLDYRCQDAQVYTLFFFFVFLITASALYYYLRYVKQLTDSLNLLLLMIVFIGFILQNLASFFSLTVKNEWEYLPRDIIESFMNDFFHSMSFIFSRSTIIVIFIIFPYMSYKKCQSDNDFDSNHALVCFIISLLGAVGAVVTSIFADKLSIVIPFFVSFYCIYVGGFLSFKLPVSFYKVAAACYILVLIFDFYYAFVYSNQPNNITKHVPLLYSIVASIVAQTVFTVVLFVGIFWKGEFCDDNFSLNILVRNQSSYTNMSSSLTDINDKTNK